MSVVLGNASNGTLDRAVQCRAVGAYFVNAASDVKGFDLGVSRGSPLIWGANYKIFCCAFVQIVSALASSFVTLTAVMTAAMMTEASVLAPLRPPRGRITILVSYLGISIGIVAAFVSDAATLLAKMARVLCLG